MTPQQMLELVELLRPLRDAEFIALLEMVWNATILDMSDRGERFGYAVMVSASQRALALDPGGLEAWITGDEEETAA